MPELGLFPLQIVVFPGERVPLHIFEPRYRELVGECLEHDLEFGILLAEESGVRRVGTRVAVAEVIERLPDGRLNIVVEGRSRFRLLERTGGRSFHTGLVEPFEDDEGAPRAAAAAADEVLRLLEALAAAAGIEVELPSSDDPELSFAVAARVELELEEEQELLELRSEAGRLARLEVLLRSAADRLRLEREVREKASRNGHLPHRPPLP